ncbi:MAG: TetR/AcrR family transcriptional regulator [Actinomycetota bacterium]|nr:TetR/AcrR family transcriptional regulator [Actinomycetota bacterium]MEC7103740.1 TetR/AcrR family transcriptional regulator [Actinomycetota bacterium]MEC8406027.1 TetR/AcrR family transcriptional regulator [Actinomycetota bacterium]MEC8647890.1 TetR/AcrR family transcriptional regulator [Actinomycetota bacterium]MED5346231.1 TetR/AcrR family transcriptional regulator [Actinomycetota bacterium]|tara:strand:- start:1055 stop:1690 length:636 start_codon:yes stop_codon:yes gene_type:complete
MATPVATSSRRTGDELIQAVHAAALAEISENGLRGASMDRIAKRAGTGKATLYRRWPNVRALGLDVFLATIAEAVPQAFPNTGSLREDLVDSMKSFTSSFRGPMALVLRELMSESAHDSALIEEFNRRLGEPMELELVNVLQRAMARGEIPTKPIDPLIFELPDALISHRLLLRGEIIDDITCEHLVDNVILPLLEFRRQDVTGDGETHTG